MRDSICTAIFLGILLASGCSSSSRPLTNEESQILIAVAPNDSYFYWTRFDGVLEVYIDGTDVVPNQKQKTTEAWLSAIESLEQRGYTSGDGLKGGVFVLTAEGHAAAAELLARQPNSDGQTQEVENGASTNVAID